MQRRELGVAPPDTRAEDAFVALCQENGGFRAYDRGVFVGLTLSESRLREQLANARTPSQRSDAREAAAVPAATGIPSPLASEPEVDLPIALTSIAGRLGLSWPLVVRP